MCQKLPLHSSVLLPSFLPLPLSMVVLRMLVGNQMHPLFAFVLDKARFCNRFNNQITSAYTHISSK